MKQTIATMLLPCSVNLTIEDITLLSTEEAEKLPLSIRQCTSTGIPCWWWLRSPGCIQSNASSVSSEGVIRYGGVHVDAINGGVRPALVISNLKSLNLGLYYPVIIFDRKWFVISKDTVICSDAVDLTTFRTDKNAPDANDYEKSDVKKYLENWLKEQVNTSCDQDSSKTGCARDDRGGSNAV